MKAVVYKKPGVVVLEERPMPVIQEPTDAIIRVTRASICSSDLHIISGAVPRAREDIILGHEFVGEVVETGGAVKRFKAGDRVSINVETFCGECYFCRRGFVNNCVHGGWELGCRIDGGQAEFVRVPMADQGLTQIPDGISDEAALFNGDILATGYWAASIAELKPADTVVIFGAGPTGLCTMMCARLYSPSKIIAVEPNGERRRLALEKGLADIVLDPAETDVVREILRLTEGRGADRVFEAAGEKGTFQMAWQAARPNAIVVLIALYEQAQELPLHQMYGKNLTFKTGGVDANACEEIMALVGCGKLDTSCLITHRAPLEDALAGYQTFAQKKDGCIKWVITPAEKGNG